MGEAGQQRAPLKARGRQGRKGGIIHQRAGTDGALSVSERPRHIGSKTPAPGLNPGSTAFETNSV